MLNEIKIYIVKQKKKLNEIIICIVKQKKNHAKYNTYVTENICANFNSILQFVVFGKKRYFS